MMSSPASLRSDSWMLCVGIGGAFQLESLVEFPGIRTDLSGLSPWWSCPNEKIDRVFVAMPHSRQTIKFAELSRLRWLYRLALGQPHQQDFIETVMQMPDDGRQDYVLSLSAWPHVVVASAISAD